VHHHHLDRLTPMDAVLVYLDGLTSPMHIAAPAIFEGPRPEMEGTQAVKSYEVV
jgi:hypothetical protein